MKTENDQPNENTEVNNTGLANVFSLFVGHDKRILRMHKPFEINGKVYATDAHTLVRTDKENIDFVLDNEHNPLNCEDVIPEVNTSVILNITKEMFEPLKTTDEYESHGEDIDCKTCDGHGVVDWEFERWEKEFDCPVCDGSGKEEEEQSRKTGGKTFGNSVVKLNDAYFHVNIFYKLVKVRDILGGEIELISYSKSTGAVMFKIGVCEIILMPVIYRDAEDWDALINIV